MSVATERPWNRFRRKLTDADVARIHELRDLGLGTEAIARALGVCTQQTVSRVLRGTQWKPGTPEEAA